MRVPIIKKVNGIDITKYVYHPRILELRLIMYHKTLSQEYDFNMATEFFRQLSTLFRCNWNFLNGIISNSPRIRALSRTDKRRYQEEVIFMGALFDESRQYVAKTHLKMAKETIYRRENRYRLDDFITQEWLDKLDVNVTICGLEHYKVEALRFIEGLERFFEVMNYVSPSKT